MRDDPNSGRDRPKRAFRLPLWSRGRIRESVDEELTFHLEQAAAELVRRGVDPEDAQERAHAEFGDLAFTKAYCTEQATRHTAGRMRMTRLEQFLQDLKYGVRTLKRNPGFALIVALTLAVGIGANASIFSMLNPYLVRPLPFASPSELVQLAQVDPSLGFASRHSLPQLEDYREKSRAFSELGAYYYGTVNLTGDEGAERVGIGRLTANFFDLLGTEPLIGRTFLAGEGGPGSQVVVLDYGLWLRRYGGDASVLGRSIRMDGASKTVIGVMPPDFVFPYNEVRLWVPLQETLTTVDRADNYMHVVGRLNDGWAEERAGAELNQIHAQLAVEHPEIDGKFASITVTPIREALNFAWGPLQAGAIILGAAVGFLLLIACVNVAGLMLARAAARKREVAIRTAVGAGRNRIIRQLITESLILSAVGGVLGVSLAWLVVGTLGPTLPDAIFRVGEPGIDRRVLFFSAAVTLATPFLFGLVPALKTVRPDLVTTLKAGSGQGGSGSLRGRGALVITQIAIAIVLVTATGLMVRSFMALNQEDLGFDQSQVLAIEIRPGAGDHEGQAAVDQFYRGILDAARSVPGVRSAATVVPLPMNHEIPSSRFNTPDATTPIDEWPRAMHFRTSMEYFDAMDIGLRSGRLFDESDRQESEPVVIISESVAERHLGGQDPIGSSLQIGNADPPLTARIVGVVEDVEEEGFQEVFGAQLYRPAEQAYTRSRYVVVGVDAPLSSTLGPVADAFRRTQPDAPVLVRPMQVVVDENSMGWSIPSLLLGVLGTIAVALASLGVYGLISFSVAQRRKELGIRIALGASGGQLQRGIVGEGLKLTAKGLVIGGALAVAAGQLLASRLYGVSPLDPVTYGLAIVLFAVVALVATARPAFLASRIEPVRVLKSD